MTSPGKFMRFLRNTFFLAVLPLSFASGAVMVPTAMEPFGWTVGPRVMPNRNVVPSSVASFITAHDSSPVIDPVPVRHGINVGSDEYLFAAKSCSATAVGCGDHDSIPVSTGCPTCMLNGNADDPSPAGVPEPAAWALAGLGLTALFFARRRARV